MGALSRPAASAPKGARRVRLRHLGTAPYEATRDAMAEFTRARTADTLDEVWLAEHPPVFTLGLNGSREHLLAPADIPVVATDRGGQVTYHGPGQVVLYPLLCLRRFGLGARSLVSLLEGCVIRVLADYAIEARADPSAPGVYVAPRRKIASIGLRIRRGCSYHGVALNVNGNLSPFTRINPCGYTGLEVTQMVDEGAPATLTVRAVGERLAAELCQRLTYNADAPISYVE